MSKFYSGCAFVHCSTPSAECCSGCAFVHTTRFLPLNVGNKMYSASTVHNIGPYLKHQGWEMGRVIEIFMPVYEGNLK